MTMLFMSATDSAGRFSHDQFVEIAQALSLDMAFENDDSSLPHYYYD
jgi:hypothetical protein